MSETIPARQLTSSSSLSNPYIVISQLNLWYYGPGCYGGFEAFNCSGQRTTSLTPYLGSTYASADPAVVHQQIEWAVEYGVDAFSLEWTTPRGIPGSLEVNIDDAFLKAPNLYKIRWCIFYDFNLRLTQTPGLNVDISTGIDFSDPQVSGTFVFDFGRFAEKYFGNSQYLSIDGRPVIYVWATWNFKGGYAVAVEEARDAAATRGYDVFIVGDEIRADTFNGEHASVFDANTAFTFLIPGTSQPWPWANVGEAAIAVDEVYQNWHESIEGLKVAGRDDFVSFQPGWAPQFDNRLADLYNNNGQNQIYVPAENKGQVTAMAEVAREHAEPVGSQGWKLVWENTWNCWQETTTIEPTANLGPKYPAGNYQFDMLEVVREVFGPETFFTVTVTVTSNPTGSGFVTVDGTSITTPQNFDWPVGSSHTLTADSPVSGVSGVRYVWVSWSDGGPQSDLITVSPSTTTYIANFKTQYQLTITMSPSDGGSTAPAAGSYWYDSGGLVSVSTTPASGYSFYYWSLDGTNVGNSPSYLVLMSSPHTLIAFFRGSSSMSLVLSGGSITLGGSVTLSGAITPTQPSPGIPAGTSVVLSYSLDEATWNSHIVTQVDSGGAYSAIWHPPYPLNYQLRASWGGNANYAGATSPTASLTVTGTQPPQVMLLVTGPPSVARGGAVTFDALVTNPDSSLTTTLYIEVTGPGGYRYFDTLQVSVDADSSGRFQFTWKAPSTAGSYQILVGLIPPRPASISQTQITVA